MEPPPKVEAHERRILLVEDDETHAELISRAFEERPAVILTVAHRLDEAIAALREGVPDMVIADLRLPDGRGIELCQGEAYPIVIMTSQGSEADAVEAMRAGALDYVVKSDVMFEEMPHVVDRALREWSLLRANDRANLQLQAQYEIASALATSSSLETAGPAILESICRCVGWPAGELWRVDERTDRLRRVAFFAAEPELQRIAFPPDRDGLARGQGLPGLTWARGETVSLTTEDTPDPPWHPVIGELGLRAGFGFPLDAGRSEPFAVFSFFARDAGHLNGDLARLIRTVSVQLGLFAERQREHEQRRRLQAELDERERLAAVGETAAALAHEISNPLNAMYVQAQLLQRRIKKLPELDPKIARDVEVLLSENVRLSDLLRDFRAMSRRSSLQLSQADVAEICDRLIQLQSPLLRANAIQLVRELPDDLPTITADAAKVQQVLLNLIKNAIEAMPDGGTLTLRAHTEGQRVIVEIADTGPGLPEGVDVFEPFETTKPAGTGLGLPLARQVLVAHGGTINCDSTPQGATFRIVLPTRPPEIG